MKKNIAIKIFSAIVLAAAMALIGVIAVGAETVNAEAGPEIAVVPEIVSTPEGSSFSSSLVQPGDGKYCGKVTVYVTGCTADKISYTVDGAETKPGSSVFEISGTGYTGEKVVVTAGGATCEFTLYKGHILGGRNTKGNFGGDSCSGKNGENTSVGTINTCRFCGGLYVDKKLPDMTDQGVAGPHSFVETVKTSCDGTTKYTINKCSTCGYIKVETEGTDEGADHEWKGSITYGCDSVIMTYEECTKCGAVRNVKAYTPVGHMVSESKVTYKYENDDCTKDGKKIETCMKCGVTFEINISGNADHKFNEKAVSVTEEATCENPGKGTVKCTNPGCKVTQEREIPTVGHKYEAEVTKAPLCTENGIMTYTCSVCGDTYTEPIPKVEGNGTGSHSLRSIGGTPATCDKEGSVTYKCEYCPYEETETVEKTEHRYKSTGDCTAARVCEVCGATAEPLATEHNFDEYMVVGGGYHKVSCSNEGCNKFKTEKCYPANDDHDCTTDDRCVCGNIVVQKKSSHQTDTFLTSYEPVNETQHNIICGREGCNQVIDTRNHFWGNAADGTENTCIRCGYVKTDTHEHEYVPNHDDTEHWMECKICHLVEAGTRKPHDAVPSGARDCTVAVVCSCGYVTVPAQSTHAWCGEWHDHGETHYQHCTNPGCAVLNEFDHTPEPDDHNCTTPLICSLCKHVIVEAASDHSWSADAKAHDGEYHTLKCSVDGCHAEKLEKHTAGIAATCNSQAECITCHSKFGDVDKKNHTGGTEIRDAKPATTESEGYTGDKYCVGCGAKLEEGTVIEKLTEEHVHIFDGYEYDADGHWAVCKCGEKDPSGEKVPHEYGVYTNNGATHSRTCTVCGEVDDEPHEHGEAVHDCTKAILCADCGAIIEEAQTSHNFTRRVVGTAEGHTVACVNPNCDVTTDVTPHTGGSASCTSGAHCEICGVEYTEKDASHHTGGTELRDHKDATTTEEGYTGDTYCLGCGEIISKGTAIEKLPEDHEHAFGDWMADGTHHWRECTCGDESERAAHTFENGKCTVCGASDPNYTVGDVLIDNDVTLTPEENKEHYAGLKLVVEDVEKTDAKYAEVEETVGKKFEEYVPFDITLVNKADGSEAQPNGKITVTIPVPAGWKAEETSVYHVSGDKTEKIDVKVSGDGAHVVFTTDHLSIYVLVNTSTEITEPDPVPPTQETTDPADTTKEPDDTTKEPDDTTATPADTTAKPAETTAAPTETTAAPTETTAAPAETTTKPAETTGAPEPTKPPVTGETFNVTAVCVMLVVASLSGVCATVGAKRGRKN